MVRYDYSFNISGVKALKRLNGNQSSCLRMHIGMRGILKLLCVRRIEFIVSVLKFLLSPGVPGLGFGTVPLIYRSGCQGFSEPNLFTLLNKNQTPLKEGIFDLWDQR